MKPLFVLLMSLLSFSALAQGVWSGKVIDQSTGKPVAKAKVYAGIPGRVDVSPPKETAADGSFSVAYPPKFSNASYCLYIESPAKLSYYNQVRERKSPGQVVASLVPCQVFFKGSVLNAAGQPVRDAMVQLMVPGAIWETVKTDASGRFAFSAQPAFRQGRAQFNWYGVPANEVRKDVREEPLKENPFGLVVMVPNTAEVRTVYKGEQPTPKLAMLSAVNDSVYTEITVRLPAAGQPSNPSLITSVVRKR